MTRKSRGSALGEWSQLVLSKVKITSLSVSGYQVFGDFISVISQLNKIKSGLVIISASGLQQMDLPLSPHAPCIKPCDFPALKIGHYSRPWICLLDLLLFPLLELASSPSVDKEIQVILTSDFLISLAEESVAAFTVLCLDTCCNSYCAGYALLCPHIPICSTRLSVLWR